MGMAILCLMSNDTQMPDDDNPCELLPDISEVQCRGACTGAIKFLLCAADLIKVWRD